MSSYRCSMWLQVGCEVISGIFHGKGLFIQPGYTCVELTHACYSKYS